jgi:hypothetical protein
MDTLGGLGIMYVVYLILVFGVLERKLVEVCAKITKK